MKSEGVYIFVIRSWFLFVSVSFYLPRLLLSSSVEEKCAHIVRVIDDDLLEVSNWTSLTKRSPCTVKVTSASTNYRMMLQVLRVKAECSQLHVDILDSDGITPLTAQDLCGDGVPTLQMVSSNNQINLVLTSNVTSQDAVFQLLSVSFHMAPCDDDHEFECDNGRCVAQTLECNGFNNCGDNSDETDGCLLTPSIIAIIAACSISLIAAVIFVSFFLYRRNSKKPWLGEPRLIAGIGTIQDSPQKKTFGKLQLLKNYGATLENV